MVHPVSVSSLCGQNDERQHSISDGGCKKIIQIITTNRKPLLLMEKSSSLVEHLQIMIYFLDEIF